MVQIYGSEREIVDMRRSKKLFDEMSNLDKLVTGTGGKHLVLPMMDIYNLRRVAGILNGLAAEFDMLSRRTDLTARLIVLSTQDAVNDANRRIREMTGKGKTKKPYRREGDA